MPLFTLADAELAYGDVPLLDRASLAMEAGERIGLIGRNGTGKSSLLGILAGLVALDDGKLQKNDGLRIAYVPQEPVVSFPEGVKKHRLEEYLHRLKLDAGIDPATMSGGERKRAALAIAFAQEPDLDFAVRARTDRHEEFFPGVNAVARDGDDTIARADVRVRRRRIGLDDPDHDRLIVVALDLRALVQHDRREEERVQQHEKTGHRNNGQHEKHRARDRVAAERIRDDEHAARERQEREDVK